MPSKPIIPRVCQHCGLGFLGRQTEIDRGGALFCGPRCQYAARRRPLAERFWEKVQQTDSCWLWLGATACGYGIIASPSRQMLRANRVSWELHFGPIPDGLFVCHRCDVRACVKPAHLFLGTHRENMDDMVAKDRHRWGERSVNAKLSLANVHEIWTRYAAGSTTQSELAALFGVAQVSIHRVLSGKYWKDAAVPAKIRSQYKPRRSPSRADPSLRKPSMHDL